MHAAGRVASTSPTAFECQADMNQQQSRSPAVNPCDAGNESATLMNFPVTDSAWRKLGQSREPVRRERGARLGFDNQPCSGSYTKSALSLNDRRLGFWREWHSSCCLDSRKPWVLRCQREHVAEPFTSLAPAALRQQQVTRLLPFA